MAAANASLGDLRTWTHHVLYLTTMATIQTHTQKTWHLTFFRGRMVKWKGHNGRLNVHCLSCHNQDTAFTARYEMNIYTQFYLHFVCIGAFPIIAPYSSSSTRCSYMKDKQTKAGNLPKKATPFQKSGSIGERNTSTFFFSSVQA